jgi:hypothetical protein
VDAPSLRHRKSLVLSRSLKRWEGSVPEVPHLCSAEITRRAWFQHRVQTLSHPGHSRTNVHRAINHQDTSAKLIFFDWPKNGFPPVAN